MSSASSPVPSSVRTSIAAPVAADTAAPSEIPQLQRYRYTGPLSTVTLTAGATVTQEITLVPESVVELPPSHEHVQLMERFHFLTRIDD